MKGGEGEPGEGHDQPEKRAFEQSSPRPLSPHKTTLSPEVPARVDSSTRATVSAFLTSRGFISDVADLAARLATAIEFIPV